MSNINLFFPQWQGSGDKSLHASATLLKNKLKSKIHFIDVPLSTGELVLKNNILGYDVLLEQLQGVKNILEDKTPDAIFILGGDCSVDIAPISYLNKKYNGNLGVVWFDAHGDLNTPESSPSKHFHGMPLRTLLGEGDGGILDSCFSSLKSNQIVLAGTRDLDAPEKDFIQAKQIKVLSDVREAISYLKSIAISNIYIHIDLDVLDPKEFPFVKCPTEGGLSIHDLESVVKDLNNQFNVLGHSVLEYCSLEGQGIQVVDKLAFF